MKKEHRFIDNGHEIVVTEDGYVFEDGVCVAQPGTDADFDRYAVQVQNGDGYYDMYGNYRSYRKDSEHFLRITVEDMATNLTNYQGKGGIGIDEMWNMYRDIYWGNYLDDYYAFEDFCYMYENFLEEKQNSILYANVYDCFIHGIDKSWEQGKEIIRGYWEDAEYCIEITNIGQKNTVEFLTEEELKDRITSKDFFVYLYTKGDKEYFELDEYRVKEIIARANELIKKE